MKIINISVTDKLKVTSIIDGDRTLNASSPVQIASGNYKSVVLNFEFESTTWEDLTLTKYATFTLPSGERIQSELTQIETYQHACYMPYSALKKNGKVNLGVYGVNMYNSSVNRIVSSENLYLLVVDGSFSIYLTDETPVKVDTLTEQVKRELDSYAAELESSFNNNYNQKINNYNSNILTIETNAEQSTGVTFNQWGDSKRIENSINHFFALTPDEKTYTVKFPLWETSNTCAGEKLDDNIGKYVNLATDTVREESNYGPAWETVDCNAVVDSNGVRHITAIKGMSNFRDVGEVDVFVLKRTYYQKIWVENGYLYISRRFVPTEGYTVVQQAINKDGTINPWFLVAKYVSGKINNKPYSSKGLIPARNMSYNNCVNQYHTRGTYYSGGSMADYLDILTTFYLKFATKNTQSIMAGNTNNNYQYQVAQAESNVHRVIVTTAQAANIDIYSCVAVGDWGSNTNADRGNNYIYNIVESARVIGKEVIDSSKTALILDCNPFNTTSTTRVSTIHEISGYSDLLLGRNGSLVSNTNGKHGMVLDGIEVAIGGYEVSGNAFMNIINSANKREVYVCNDASRLTTNMTTAKANYKKISYAIEPTNLNAWNGITEYGFDLSNGIAVPTKSGQSGSGNSVGYADSFYADNAASGEREFLLLGALNNTPNAGLSCVNGNSGISSASWSILARLSINGVGGELA